MPDVHTIRLRGPWDLQWFPSVSAAEVLLPQGKGEGRRVTLPAESLSELPEAFCGKVVLGRNFHRPTGLGSGDRVLLVVTSWQENDVASLNGQPLTPEPNGNEARFEISKQMTLRNFFELQLAWPRKSNSQSEPDPDTPSLIGDARLEIYSAND